MTSNKTLIAYASTIALFSMYATEDALSKFLAVHIPLTHILTIAVISSLVVSSGILVWRRINPFQNKKDALLSFSVGLLVFGAGFCSKMAFTYIPITDAYIISFLSPIVLCVFGFLFLGEKIGWMKWTGVVGAFLCIVSAYSIEGSMFRLASVWWIMWVLCFTVQPFIMKRISSGFPSIASLWFSTIGSLLLLVILWYVQGVPFHVSTSLERYALLGMMILDPLAMFLWFYVQKISQVSLLAIVEYIEIPWSVLYGYLLFGDALKMSSVLLVSGIFFFALLATYEPKITLIQAIDSLRTLFARKWEIPVDDDAEI